MLGAMLKGDTTEERILHASNIQRKYIFPVWGVVALALVGMTAQLAYVGGRAGHYTDVTESWEACMFQPNYVVIPIENSNIANILKSLGIPIENANVTKGAFGTGLIYLCCQTITFTLLGLLMIFRSWNHIGWILPSGFFGLWCSLLSITYYTSAPPLPVASETTTTILLLSIWLKKSSWVNLNDGNNQCESAYYYVLIVLILNIILIALLSVCNTFAFSLEYIRLTDPARVPLKSPNGSFLVLILTLVMMVCYVGAFIGRVATSVTSLQALEDYNTKLEDIVYEKGQQYLPDIYYPFKAGFMNLTSMCWAVIYISAARAYFGSRIAAYKTAAAASLVYFLTNTSSMFYIMALYYDLELEKDTVCFNYFQQPEVAAYFLYPNDYQSKVYCQGTRVSTFLALSLYICSLIMFLLASYFYYAYADEYDPEIGDAVIENGTRVGGQRQDLGGEYYIFDDPGLPRESSKSKRASSQSVKLLNAANSSA